MTGDWHPEKGYRRIMLKDLVTEVKLGVHAWEQHPEKPQKIVVNIDMYADDEPFAPGAAVIDYDHVRDAIRSWPARPHTLHIETLLEDLVALCFRDARVKACRVSIQKPDIFNEAAGAGVELFRIRP